MIRQIKGKDCEMERNKEWDKAMKNNNIFQRDVGNFYRKTNERSKYKGQVPTMDKLVKFLADVWEDESETLNKKWMEKIKQSMKDKIRLVEELHNTEQELGKTIRKIKNWSAPGIDGISNF